MCNLCLDQSPVYDMNCAGCKTRFIQAEPCKMYRKVLVDQLGKRCGTFDGWQEGKHCDCTAKCKRKANIYEEPTKRKGKTIPSPDQSYALRRM